MGSAKHWEYDCSCSELHHVEYVTVSVYTKLYHLKLFPSGDFADHSIKKNDGM